MIMERIVHQHPLRLTIPRSVGTIFLLLLVAGFFYMVAILPQCIDGCGPYHNTTSVADSSRNTVSDSVMSGICYAAPRSRSP